MIKHVFPKNQARESRENIRTICIASHATNNYPYITTAPALDHIESYILLKHSGEIIWEHNMHRYPP